MRTQRWSFLVAALCVSSTLGVVFGFAGDGDAYSARVALARGLGLQSFGLLGLSLCVTPAQRVLSRLGRALTHAAQLRRALGLAALASGLVHAGLGIASSPWDLATQLTDAQLRFGVGALVVLCLLGVTSYPSVVKRLGMRSWKELHRLAYLAWICALLHALLGPYASWGWISVASAGLVVALGLLRLLPLRGAGD